MHFVWLTRNYLVLFTAISFCIVKDCRYMLLIRLKEHVLASQTTEYVVYITDNKFFSVLSTPEIQLATPMKYKQQRIHWAGRISRINKIFFACGEIP